MALNEEDAMAREKPVTTRREGGKYEGAGFLMIVGGMLVAMAASPPVSTFAGVIGVSGIVVFLMGRFK